MTISTASGKRLLSGSAAAVSGGTFTSYTSGGNTYNVYTFTASGTLTVAAAGQVDVLVVGGGGAGGFGGGGAGGVAQGSSIYFASAGTYTVTVGAGGASYAAGISSSLNGIMA